MAIWLPSIDMTASNLAHAIAGAIAADIASGRLAAGDRLPPQRILAYALGLSPDTVMRAYAEAGRRGLVAGAVGRGTYVRTPERPVARGGLAPLSRIKDGPVDFSRNLPFAGAAAPALASTLAGLAGERDLADLLDRGEERVRRPQAEAAAAFIGRLGLAADPGRILFANGGQQGILAALMTLTRPGDTLLTEALTYQPVKTLARHLGLRVVGVAMDGEGMLPAALDVACRRGGAKVVYLMPTLQTPTSATMSEERRREIVRLAAIHDLTLIEDDVFGFLPSARPAPIAAIAPERTLFITSVSKSMAPGLRVGYVVAPERWRSAIETAIAVSAWMPPPLMVEIARRWIEDGTAVRLNAAQQAHAARRQTLARRLLGDRPFAADAHGLHLWLPLPSGWSGAAFTSAALEAGVRVNPGDLFSVGAESILAVRLCLSYEVDDGRVEAGLRTVAGLLAGPDGGSPVI